MYFVFSVGLYSRDRPHTTTPFRCSPKNETLFSPIENDKAKIVPVTLGRMAFIVLNGRGKGRLVFPGPFPEDARRLSALVPE